MLGAEYELASPVVSITAALITSTFGFASGFIAYRRKRLIDYQQAKTFLMVSIPMALLGSLVCHMIPPNGIRLFYGILMLVLACVLLRKRRSPSKPDLQKQDIEGLRKLISKDGTIYKYSPYPIHLSKTALGGFLTGLLSTGIGEMVMPQLLKKGQLPVPVAAATSVLVVIGTFLAAALSHTASLVQSGGVDAVPWHLVCYTVPGVVIGGQIGPRLQGKVRRPVMVRIIAIVFLLIGLAMLTAVMF